MKERRTRTRARIPRSEDPLGFGLRSVPEPLQRLWLIRQGNPYFEADAKDTRLKLGIPVMGFQEPAKYIDWSATRWKRHGHDDSLGPMVLVMGGIPLRGSESLFRFTHKDWQLPTRIMAPKPCCDADPLFHEARLLARRYGIEEAEGEPGFEATVEDVAGYLLKPAWPPRRLPGRHIVERKDDFMDYERGHWVYRRWREEELGLESRAGKGGQLPIWYEWWKRRRRGDSINDIAGTMQGEREIFDERSIRSGIAEVERLMQLVEKVTTA